jgi:hypothetical protein
VYLEIRGDRVQVHDADDCGSLDIRVAAAARSQLDRTLRDAELGRWAGGPDAELNVVGLRDAAGAAGVGADWGERWDSMLAYARAKGWLSADGSHLAAHLVDLRDG